MARPLRIQYPGAFYHVTCRGNERRKIFLGAHDYKVFLEKLSLSLDIYNVSLMAYVCMPNHFHLLVTTPDGNLSEFMRHLNISYTSAFNRIHRRVGHLYQGRYKAFLIDADNYLMEVSRYIHLNPIRGKAFSKKAFSKKPAKKRWEALSGYKTSTLPGYLYVRKRTDLVDYKTILDYMGGDNRKGRDTYRRFIRRGVERGIENPLELGKGHGIVGETDFVEWIRENFLSKKASKRELPALRQLRKRFKPNELIENFARLTKKDKRDVCQRGKNVLERSMLMELLYRFCDITQPEIGRLAGGIDYSAVSQARKRLHIRMEQEPKLKKRFNKLSNQLLRLSRTKI